MSVLTNLVRERAAWGARYKVASARGTMVRNIVEYSVLVLLGIAFCLFQEKISIILQMLVH